MVKNVVIVLVVLVCVITLFRLTIGESLESFFTAFEEPALVLCSNSDSDFEPSSDEGQTLVSLFRWFSGLETLFEGVARFFSSTGKLLMQAWEAIEGWIASVGQGFVSFLDNVTRFFGWVNDTAPEGTTPEGTTPEGNNTSYIVRSECELNVVVARALNARKGGLLNV